MYNWLKEKSKASTFNEKGKSLDPDLQKYEYVSFNKPAVLNKPTKRPK